MKLSFKNRIRLGYLIILVFFVLYCLFAIIQLKNISKNVITLYEHPILVRKTIKDINIEMYKKALFLNDFVHAQSKQKTDSLIVLMGASDSLLDQNFVIVYERFLGDKKDIDTVYQFYKDFNSGCSQIILSKLQNRTDSIHVLMELFNKLYLSKIQSKTFLISSFAETKANELVYSSIKTENIAFYLSVILFGIILILSLLFITLITRSITRPINKFLKSASEIFSLKLTEKIIKNENELFEYAISDLKESHQNITLQNKEIAAQNVEYQLLNETLKLSNEKLIQIERNYKLIFESSGTANTIFNASGILIMLNTLAAEFIAKEVPAAIGLSVFDIFGEKEGKIIFERIQGVINTGVPEKFETELHFFSGAKWFKSVYQPVLDENKIIVGIQVISQDITERKRVEQAIKDSEAKYKSIVDTAMVGIGIAKGNLSLFSNPALQEIYGYSENEIVNKPFLEFFHDDDKPLIVDRIRRRAQGETPDPNVQYRIVRKNGEIRHILLSVSLFNADNEQYYQAIVVDVTEKIQAEKAFQESEARYLTFLEGAPVAIGVNVKGYVAYVNKAFLKLFGYGSLNEMQEKPIINHTAPQARDAMVERIKRLLAGQGVEQFYYTTGIRKDGSEFNDYVGSAPFKFRGEMGSISFHSDVTDQLHNEKELEKYRNHLEDLVKKRTEELLTAKELAENANRLKTEFLSNMSHELRTPLNAILGFSKILKSQQNITEVQKEQLTTVYDCGSHLLSLINDILDMGKIENNKTGLSVSEVYLPGIIRTSINLNKIKADEKGLKYTLVPMGTVPEYINSDEPKLKQIMINLISNAVKFTNQGSIIIRVGYLDFDNMFVFEVEDTGIGIPVEKQKEIFEPFIQHTGSIGFIEGAGLGLSITKKLVEMMDGNISLKSTPNKGSVFTVKIPLQKAGGTGLGKSTVHNSEVEQADIISESDLVFPEKIIIHQIIENAEIGDYNSIRKTMDELLITNKKYETFCRLMIKQAKNYDKKGIFQLLKQIEG